MRLAAVKQALIEGRAHHAAGRVEVAERIYRQVLEAHPNQPQALHLVGVAAMDRGRYTEAVEWITRAIEHLGQDPDFHFNLGVAQAACNRPDEAIAAYRHAIELRPEFAEAHNNLGGSMKELRRFEDAAQAYLRAVQLQPGSPVFHSNLSSALSPIGRTDEAIAAAQRAIQIYPVFAEAYSNLASALIAAGRDDEALEALRRAVALRPDFVDAHYALGLQLLTLGQFEEGFRQCEWRLRAGIVGYPSFSQPMWDGSPLKDRTLLIRYEQGLGDTIQLIRYAPMLAAQGAKVIAWVQPQLKRLLTTMPSIEQVITVGDPIPPFDVHCPLLSLPYHLKTTLQTIPAQVPYLSADPAQVQRFAGRLEPAGLKVGLVWAGNPAHKGDHRRSIPLSALSSLWTIKGVTWISLQKDGPAEQLRALPQPSLITDWGPDLSDFADTAAAIESLDLLITVDTAAAHLAGAMNKPAWVFLPFVKDSRWMNGRADSPWYPSLRLFRQERSGDWNAPIDNMARELGQLSASRAG